MKIDPINFFDYLKKGQWRISIVGESWYDEGCWIITISDPLHIDITEYIIKDQYITLHQACRNAIAKFAKENRNGHMLSIYRKALKRGTFD